MVDFTSRLKKREIIKKINPIEIYDNIDRKSVTGPLRPVQNKILNEWYLNRKDDKDLIIKLHTGAGKTLIGLLILQSKLNSNNGPCMYVCPNKYLVSQVCKEAEKFGIHYCCIESDNIIPNSFLLGKSILITHVQKLFNGKSIFGINNNFTKVGTIILDDSHACIDSINDSFTININKKSNLKLYNEILELFSDDLKEQGEGTLLDIKNEEYDQFLPVPYWSWENKKDDVLKLLSSNKDIPDINFSWPLLKDKLTNCMCYINGKKIEISPYKVPIYSFGSFHFAKNRILMSATTQNDAFFIKGLDFNINAVKNPLIDNSQIWSGEKMIISPSLIHPYFTRDAIIANFAPLESKFGIVSITPSFELSKNYDHYGAKIANNENIFNHITKLKSEDIYQTVVFSNRYDGIDLPDDSCRILILDSLPYSDSLADKYIESCIPNSEIINVKLAQKVEQGIGRSVRGEKDYSAILLIGTDLTKFINSVETKKYFSPQTQKQIDIGLEIADMLKTPELEKEATPSLKSINDLLNQLLYRDPAWKEFYEQLMNEIPPLTSNNTMYETLFNENKAEEAFENGEYDQAIKIMQELVDSSDNDLEKGWYLQQLARYKFRVSKLDSNRLQQIAFKKNKQLLKPKEGISYTKIEYINQKRTKKIKLWLSKFDNFNEMNLFVDNLLETFRFGMIADKFESSLDEIGNLLGFECQRPDKLIRKGPDNLWCLSSNEYLLFECKSEVSLERKEINKVESGQMNNHCAWFKSQYPNSNCKNILIIPTKNLSYCADFSDDVSIMRQGKLKTFKKNIKEFIKEFKSYNIKELDDEKIQEFIQFHKLDIVNLKKYYCEDYYHLPK